MEKEKKKSYSFTLPLNMATVWLLLMYMAGIAVAKGSLKLMAIIFPPYAWYLLVEKIMQHFQLI